MKSLDYETFVASKLANEVPTGIEGATVESPHLFDFQRDLTQWALRRGRAAIFASMGLGKGRIGITWAQRVHEHTNKPTLIFAPLAVGEQMRREGDEIGIPVRVVRSSDDVSHGVNVCNYERMQKLDAKVFGGVVCDESSCVKGLGSRTLAQLLDAFGETPFRLAETATPAPNSFEEFGQHCELLGICSRSEMLSEFFQHDGSDTAKWMLKGHGRKAFWRFVSSWGALVRSPADLGYDASAYDLPPINHEFHVLPAPENAASKRGMLFAEPARTLMERRAARRASEPERVAAVADLVNSDDEPWVVWADFNSESAALAKALNGAVEVTGSMDVDAKEDALRSFIDGSSRVLVTKPQIAAHGLNLQFSNRMAFAGVSDSFEQQYQAIGRIHRFGQKRETHIHYFLGELERAVLENVRRKRAEAEQMAGELASETRDMVRAQVCGQRRVVNEYEPRVEAPIPCWLRSEA